MISQGSKRLLYWQDREAPPVALSSLLLHRSVYIDEDCRGSPMRSSNAGASCCWSEGAMNSKRRWQWAEGRLSDSNPKGGWREQSQSWTRPGEDALEAGWGWWEERDQDKHSAMEQLTKLKQIVLILYDYWVTYQFMNGNCCNLFHNYRCVCCRYIHRLQWLCCTQSLDPRSLCLHFEIRCPPIFAVSWVWWPDSKIKSSPRTGVPLSNTVCQRVYHSIFEQPNTTLRSARYC